MALTHQAEAAVNALLHSTVGGVTLKGDPALQVLTSWDFDGDHYTVIELPDLITDHPGRTMGGTGGAGRGEACS